MTIGRDRDREIYFECDAKRCAEALPTDCADFESALEQLKEEGWEYRKEGGEWKHFCPIHGEDLGWMK